MFIVECIKGINKSGDLLEIQGQVLYDLGANFSPEVKKGQVYRLLAAQFLHITFIHLFGNALTLIIFVSRVEYTFGWLRTLIIFIISGIGGNIFSDLTNPSDSIVKAGASTCLFGIIGCIFGYIIINWKGLDVVGRLMKCQLVFISIIIILFIFVLTPYSSNVDYMGHLGGFLTGLSLTSIHSTIRE
jgi:membrane associated rhomboid family serine protease